VHGQRGDAILEALFGIVLMSIIGLGLGFASARATLSQRYLNTQNIVISDMREQLISSGSMLSLCNTPQSAVQVGNSSTALNLDCQTNTAGGASSVSVSVILGNAGDGDGHGRRLEAVVPAGTVVTMLTLSTPANSTNQALFGGDGKIEVKL